MHIYQYSRLSTLVLSKIFLIRRYFNPNHFTAMLESNLPLDPSLCMCPVHFNTEVPHVALLLKGPLMNQMANGLSPLAGANNMYC